MLRVPRLDVHLPEPVVRQAVKEAFAKLGYHEPTQSQDEAIYHFIMGEDVFVCLPTGSGKSLCYATLPLIFDILKHAAKRSSSTEAGKSLVIVISPLVALMKDQTAKFEERGVKSAYVCHGAGHGSGELERPVKDAVVRGEVQLIYLAPECLLRDASIREMLRSEVYTDNLVAVAVDEAHCIDTWFVQT